MNHPVAWWVVLGVRGKETWCVMESLGKVFEFQTGEFRYYFVEGGEPSGTE